MFQLRFCLKQPGTGFDNNLKKYESVIDKSKFKYCSMIRPWSSVDSK